MYEIQQKNRIVYKYMDILNTIQFLRVSQILLLRVQLNIETCQQS